MDEKGNSELNPPFRAAVSCREEMIAREFPVKSVPNKDGRLFFIFAWKPALLDPLLLLNQLVNAPKK